MRERTKRDGSNGDEEGVRVNMGSGHAEGLSDLNGLVWALEKADAARARAEARLAGIRSFLAEVEPLALSSLPTQAERWNSAAGQRYAARLQEARQHIVAMLRAATDAERSAWHELSSGQSHYEQLTGEIANAQRELAGAREALTAEREAQRGMSAR